MFITAAPMPAPIPADILDMLTIAAMVGASLIALLGFFRLVVAMTEGEGLGAALLIAGVGVGLFVPFVIFWAMGDAPGAAPPTPTPTPTPEPTAPPKPADLTGVWIAFSMIAAVGLLFVAVWGSARIAHHLRRARQAARRKAITRSRQEEAWRAIHTQHDELLRRYLHAETDWDALFFTPALTDPNVPQTRRMLEAMQRANTLRSTSGDLRANLSEDADITALPYARAVAAFATAWSVAERHAKRIGQNGIPAPERKRLREARTLLAMIENGASSPTERALAYRRVQKLLEGITAIHIPDKALSALEQRSRPMITPGT